MKRPHILHVFLVSLGYCFGQTPADLFQTGQATENATISLARLRHQIPGKALAAFSRALKLARHREWQQGASELEMAVKVGSGGFRCSRGTRGPLRYV